MKAKPSHWYRRILPFTGLLILLSGCAATEVNQIEIKHVQFGGCIWSGGQRDADVLFQDGAQSIPVADGSLWLFGDTFFGKPQPGKPPQNSQIRGSDWTTLAFLPSGATNLPPALQYFTDAAGTVSNAIPLLPGEDPKHTRIWPDGGINLDRRVYLYYSLIGTTDDPGPWNFHGRGGGLSVSDSPLGRFRRLQLGGQWKFPVEPIQVIREKDMLYLMEVRSGGLILARVKSVNIEAPSAYRFFTGQGWSQDRSDASVILREVHGQVSVMRLPAKGGYLLATSSDFSRPREIQIYRAKDLAGPWVGPARITVPELPGKKTNLVYCTYLHPELSGSDSNRVVATFCRTLDGQWALSNPEWLTLELSR